MIVQESDILLAALDRRMQVDPVAAVDPLSPVSRASGTPQPPPASTFATGTSQAGLQNAAAPLATRLPLGQLITARVVDVPQPDHVVAEVGDLRIALAWPKGNGVAPQPGRDIGLRVLAHQPMLLFESASLAAVEASPDDPASPTHWSSDAMRLQPAAAGGGRADGLVRFDAPILDIEIVPLDERGRADVPDDVQPGFGRTPPGSTLAVGPARIALDDVIVARSTALVDGIDVPLIPRAPDDGPRAPAAFMPLVLQGPAWPGQPMELVVRRERKDDAFDNPALDHWCGEVLIDLPNLGRVAGHLAFSMQGLRIRLEGDDAGAVDAMTVHATELAHAMTTANLRVSALSVGRPAADARRPAGEATRLPRDG